MILRTLPRTLAALATVMVTAGSAFGQESIVVEQFEPRAAASGILNATTSDLLEGGDWTASLWLGFVDGTLEMRRAYADDPRPAGDILDLTLRGDLVGAFGIIDGLQVSIGVPYIVPIDGATYSPGITGANPDDPGLAIGDTRLVVDLEPGALFGDRPFRPGGFGFGLTVTTFAPTGSESLLESEGQWRVEPRLTVDWRRGGLRAAVNAAWMFRPRSRFYNVISDDMFRWNVAVEAPVWGPLTAMGTVYASHHGVEQPDPLDVQQTIAPGVYDPAEWLAAVRYRFAGGPAVLVGGGTGLSKGIGSPAWRVTTQVAFGLPEVRADGAATRPDDIDGDSVLDERDVCPHEAEKPDGVRDADGCPEAGAALVRRALGLGPKDPIPPLPALESGGLLPDADGDKVPDEIDICPAEPEDRDGVADGDGCPEADDDRDGIADAADQCPTVAETVNGIEDADGCPEIGPDGDGDGIGDVFDVCPNERETVNDVRDWDGCPEGYTGRWGVAPTAPVVEPLPLLPVLPKAGDSDGDGVADDDDVCPDEPEDRDGFADTDGCPDADDDRDGVADGADQCPLRAESANGFEDADGCPDIGDDADGDKIGDYEDVCPYEPERVDGVRDWDGCPERVIDAAPPVLAQQILPPLVPAGDPDGDGLSGDDDLCPMSPEDQDGFEDLDGCPEEDDDKDGIADEIDQCRLEAETFNFYNDDDGCPDLAPSQISGIVGVVESIQFKVGRSTLEPWALPTLRRVARAMKKYPRLRLRIDGHTDSTGELERNYTLSNDRAASVRAWLVEQGIDSSRLSSFGYGPDRPIAPNTDLQGRFKNRRVELSYTEPAPGARP